MQRDKFGVTRGNGNTPVGTKVTSHLQVVRSYAKWCQCTFTIFTCVRFYAKASQNDRFTISTLEKQINCDY